MNVVHFAHLGMRKNVGPPSPSRDRDGIGRCEARTHASKKLFYSSRRTGIELTRRILTG